MTAPATTNAQDVYMERVRRECANWGIYGENGSGKTTLAATIPPTTKTLVLSLDVENTKPYYTTPNKGEHFTIRKITKWDEIAQYYVALRRQHCDENGNPKIGALDDPNLIHCVVFDSWTGMQQLAMRKVTGVLPPEDEAAFARKLLETPKTPRGYDAWQQIGELSNEWMRYFQELPIHKLFLFGEGTREPKAPGEAYLTGPLLTPLAVIGTKRQTELLGRLYVDTEAPTSLVAMPGDERKINPNAKEVRRLLIGKHSAYATKGPSHLLGYTVESPTWEKLAVSLK